MALRNRELHARNDESLTVQYAFQTVYRSLLHATAYALSSTWPHLRCDIGLLYGNINRTLCDTVLCTVVVVHNGTSSFLQVGRLYRALTLLGLAHRLLIASVSSVVMVLYIYVYFFNFCYILCFTFY